LHLLRPLPLWLADAEIAAVVRAEPVAVGPVRAVTRDRRAGRVGELGAGGVAVLTNEAPRSRPRRTGRSASRQCKPPVAAGSVRENERDRNTGPARVAT